jgi:hypothetical protein
MEADMDRTALEGQLSMAEENVRWDIEHVRKQREKVQWLERGGRDAGQARKVLDAAEDLLLLQMADRNRLLGELKLASKRDTAASEENKLTEDPVGFK